LDHLHDVYNRQGIAVIDSLLTDTVVINVKVDQSAFVIKKQTGIVTFHGRDGRGLIDKVKRAGMDTYEDAIHHVGSRALNHIPDDLELYLELFSDKWKTTVKYKSKPKNGLIVSYAKLNGKVILPDDPMIHDMATLLDIAPPPVLFSGTLSEYHKQRIKSFITQSVDDRKSNFGGDKFINYVSNTFEASDDLHWLQECGYEGLVFYFTQRGHSAKLIDPMFTAEKQAGHKENMSRFKETLNTIVYEYLTTNFHRVLQDFIMHTKSEYSDDQYINFISYLTSDVVEVYNDRLSILDCMEDEQKIVKFSNVTSTLVPEYVNQLIQRHWWVDELFTMLLNLLQKDKKAINTRQGLTRERKDSVNVMVSFLRQHNIVR
jgi:hypothetical protein